MEHTPHHHPTRHPPHVKVSIEQAFRHLTRMGGKGTSSGGDVAVILRTSPHFPAATGVFLEQARLNMEDGKLYNYSLLLPSTQHMVLRAWGEIHQVASGGPRGSISPIRIAVGYHFHSGALASH